MVNNGSLTYDHSKDGRWTELAGCTADLRNQNHDTFLAIRYSRGRLTVSCGGSIAPVRRGSAGWGGGVAGGGRFSRLSLLLSSTSGSKIAVGWAGGQLVLLVSPLVSQVMTDVEDKNEWKNCIDIAGVQLPTGYFFGASAGTGDLSGEWAWLAACCHITLWMPSFLCCGS